VEKELFGDPPINADNLRILLSEIQARARSPDFLGNCICDSKTKQLSEQRDGRPFNGGYLNRARDKGNVCLVAN